MKRGACEKGVSSGSILWFSWRVVGAVAFSSCFCWPSTGLEIESTAKKLIYEAATTETANVDAEPSWMQCLTGTRVWNEHSARAICNSRREPHV